MGNSANYMEKLRAFPTFIDTNRDKLVLDEELRENEGNLLMILTCATKDLTSPNFCISSELIRSRAGGST